MLGAIDSAQNQVTVIGGGIAGLLIAYELDRQGFEVHLYEAGDRLGGLIRTENTPWGMVEWAAHSLLVTPKVRKLCEELGVDLIPVNADSRARYVLRRGKFRRFPLSIWEALRAFLRAYLVLSNRKVSANEMTLQTWAERFLGKPALRYLITPMLRGIYGASPSELVVGAAFPKLVVPPGHSFLSYQMARWIRSLGQRTARSNQVSNQVKVPRDQGRPQMMTAKNGMGDLVFHLEERLRFRLGERIHLSSPVSELPQKGNIVLAVPASVAAQLLKERDPPLARALEGIQYTPLLVAKVFVQASHLRKVPQGVGVLIPEGEGTDCLGILFNSSSFSNRVEDPSVVSLSLFFGGTQRPELLDLSDEEVEALVSHELAERFGLGGTPSAIVIHRQRVAIPRYDGHVLNAWRLAREGWCAKPGHVLFGNYTGTVSIRGMIEAVRDQS